MDWPAIALAAGFVAVFAFVARLLHGPDTPSCPFGVEDCDGTTCEHCNDFPSRGW